MRSAFSISLLYPLLAQCAPLVLNRAGPNPTTAPSSSSSITVAPLSTGSLSSSLDTSSTSQTTSPTPSSITPSVPGTLQPEIITGPDGSESVFIAPEDFSANSDSSAQDVRQLVMGYYPSWNSMILPPEQIDFTKFDWVDFAFVTLNQTSQLTFEDNSSSDILRRLVKSAHTSGKYAKVSIGGWDGSQYFSSAVATPASRQTCVEEIVNMVNEFDLDGVDFDWEYPGLEGSSGNQVNPSDSENFLALIQLLRPALPLGTKITAAVAQTPFAGRDGQPMSDVANFSQVLDWVMIMAYDVWQSSSDPGPNAPLYDGCSNSSQPEASVASSVKQWTQANFPAKQISLGVPFYGYVSDSNATSLRSRASSPSIRVVADGGAAQGSIAFNYIVNQGALAATSNGTYIGSHGFTRSWDQCSATPFLQSQTSRQIITYDDPESLWMKGRFAKEMGLLGVSSWDLTGDTSTWNLTASLIAGCS